MKKQSTEFETFVSGYLPKSEINLLDDKKAEVLIALLGSLRSDIIAYDDRSYRTTVWFAGLLLSATGYCVLHSVMLSISTRIIVGLGLLIFASIAQAFLFALRREHRGTGRVIDRVQATLGLSDEGCYIQGEPFFGFSGEYVPPRSILVLQIIHGAAAAFCLIIVLFFC